MKMAPFHVVMEKDAEHGWVAWVPELPGCVTEGKTKRMAKTLIADAIAGYLEAKARYALRTSRVGQTRYTIAV